MRRARIGYAGPRPSTAERGYGSKHQALRREIARLIDAGGWVVCAYCDERIEAGEPWDLGHTPGDRLTYVGPLHRACNRNTRGAGGRRDARP
jgi:hypothetical protein